MRVAGNEMDEAVIQYIKKKYNLLIGERTAEQIKLELGSAFPLDEPITMEIKGRDLIEGIPKTLTITDAEIREALAEPISIIVNAVRVALERTPPELCADIVDRGIVLTGGGQPAEEPRQAAARGDGLPVSVAEDPLSLGGAGHGEDALGLRPAAQDQPRLAAPARLEAWPTGVLETRRKSRFLLGGLVLAHLVVISRQVERAGGTSLLGQPVFARPLAAAARRGGGGRARWAAPGRATSACAACAREPAPPGPGAPRWRWSCSSSRSRLREAGAPARDPGAAPVLPFETLVAEVIAADGVPWFRTVTIDKGATDGVALNAPVISATGVVGRVMAVGPQAAKVQLLLDRESGRRRAHRAQPDHRGGGRPGGLRRLTAATCWP